MIGLTLAFRMLDDLRHVLSAQTLTATFDTKHGPLVMESSDRGRALIKDGVRTDLRGEETAA